jgi:hypothetical protein
MNLGVKFRVVNIDGTASEHKMRPITQVAAEREFGGSIVKAFESQELSKLYWLAWHAATNGTGTFDGWLAAVDTIEFDFGAPENPTSPALPGT